MSKRLIARRLKKKSSRKFVSRNKQYYLRCKVCGEKQKVGGPDVISTICGDCYTLDPWGVARARAGRSVKKLTLAKRIEETEDSARKRKEKKEELKETRKEERREARLERRKEKRTFAYFIGRYWDKKQRKIQRKKDRELEKKDRKKNKKKRSKKKYYGWKVEYDGKRKKVSFDKKKSERQVVKYYKEKGKKLSFIRRIKES